MRSLIHVVCVENVFVSCICKHEISTNGSSASTNG
jgi:hypothetical protein